jgi:hypothetical protein
MADFSSLKPCTNILLNVSFRLINDFVTGEKIPDVGAEANRQVVERYLVAEFMKDSLTFAVTYFMTFGSIS